MSNETSSPWVEDDSGVIFAGKKPPVGRPPGPALDKAPPPHQPQAPASPCSAQTGMSDEAFWGGVRATIRREVIRLAKGTENIDNAYTLTPVGEKMIEDLVQAFVDGKQVPGLAPKADSSGKCIMNWWELACFTRYYAGTAVTGHSRDHIREQLAQGVTVKELMDDELVGMNWYFCDKEVPEDEKQYCCPPDLLDDWYYKDLTEGKVQETSGGTKNSILSIALIGIGVLAVAAAISVMSNTVAAPERRTVPRGS